MLLLAAISCMMVLTQVRPIRKRKRRKRRRRKPLTAWGDSVFVDSLGNEIKPKLKQLTTPRRWTRCRKLYGNIIKWWMTVFALTVSPERNRVE